MTLTPPPPSNPLFLSPRPSMSAALKTAATSPFAPVIALVTAISSAFGAFQAYQESQQVARASYETLKVASETNAAGNAACRQDLVALKVWVQEISTSQEARLAAMEKAISRKVTKASAPPIAPPKVEPAPKAPLPPLMPAPAALPPFDALDH